MVGSQNVIIMGDNRVPGIRRIIFLQNSGYLNITELSDTKVSGTLSSAK